MLLTDMTQLLCNPPSDKPLAVGKQGSQMSHRHPWSRDRDYHAIEQHAPAVVRPAVGQTVGSRNARYYNPKCKESMK